MIGNLISEPTPTSAQHSTASRFPLGLSQVWVRFLLAIVGLIVAFGAALFSTILSESGNLWGTIVLASAALRGDTVYTSDVGDLERLREGVAGLRTCRSSKCDLEKS